MDSVLVTEKSFEKLNMISGGYLEKTYLVRKRDDNRFFAMNVFQIERAMEQVFRRELFEKLKRERFFKEDQVRQYAVEILSLIDTLHKKNLGSIPLKPENIGIDINGHLKLLNYSKILSPTHRNDNYQITTTFGGSPEYIAPEILIDNINEDERLARDFWSFGILLYEMLMGITPFYSEDINEMYENIVYSGVSFPKIITSVTPHYETNPISSHSKDLIGKLLVKDRKQRLTSCEEIKKHPFFQSVDWKEVEAGIITIPIFKPELESEGDTRYYDKIFLAQGVESSEEEEEEGELFTYHHQNIFQAFTFHQDGSGNNNAPNNNNVVPVRKKKKKKKKKNVLIVQKDDFYYCNEEEERRSREYRDSERDLRDRLFYLLSSDESEKFELVIFDESSVETNKRIKFFKILL